MYSPPPFPQMPPPPPAPPQRSRKMMWVGIVMIVLSLGSCAAGVVTAGKLIIDGARAADPVSMGEPAVVTLDKSGVGTILGFGSTHDEAQAVDPSVVGPDGSAVPVSSFGSTGTSDNQLKGKSVAPIGTFTARSTGIYTVTATGAPGAELAVIRLSPSDLAVRLFGGVGLGAVLLITGIILIVVSAVRRRRA